METRIFFDMDGVLCDFESQMKFFFGPDIYSVDVKDWPWDKMEHHFYSTIPVINGSMEFIKNTEKLYPYKVRILTGTTRNYGCFSGKSQWISEKWNKFMVSRMILCASKDKYLLSGPGRLLIDDRSSNIESWIEQGGEGYLVKEGYPNWEEIGNWITEKCCGN